jgi:hypothetical protein
LWTEYISQRRWEYKEGIWIESGARMAWGGWGVFSIVGRDLRRMGNLGDGGTEGRNGIKAKWEAAAS